MAADPTRSTLKELFALSGNLCAYRPCDQKLADPSWSGVVADVAHIRGEKPGSARYDAAMTDEERRSFPNLMVLCPNHHRIIDIIDPEGHPPALLEDWKARREQHTVERRLWASDAELDRFVEQVMALRSGEHAGSSEATVPAPDAYEDQIGAALARVVLPPARILTGHSAGLRLSPDLDDADYVVATDETRRNWGRHIAIFIRSNASNLGLSTDVRQFIASHGGLDPRTMIVVSPEIPEGVPTSMIGRPFRDGWPSLVPWRSKADDKFLDAAILRLGATADV